LSDSRPAVGGNARRRARPARLYAWLGVLLSLACLAWLIGAVDWPGVGTVLTQVDYRLVAVALTLNLMSVLLRVVRWRLMFHDCPVPSFKRAIAALLVGQAMNVLTPTRLGDLARATLAGTGQAAYVLGTLAVELTLDLLMLLALVVLLSVGLAQSAATLPAWWRGSGYALVVTAIVALGVVIGLVIGRRGIARVLERLAARWRHPVVQRVLTWIGQLLLSLDTLGRTAQLLPALAWSVLIWGLYGAVNYTLLVAVGERPSVLIAFFLLAVLQLGVAVPSSPGRLGVYHYLCIQALAVFGVGGPKALSYAIILHLISVVVPVALGAALAWRLGVRMWNASHGVEEP
jgi:uncharacterized protein (TIRG00374 family)